MGAEAAQIGGFHMCSDRIDLFPGKVGFNREIERFLIAAASRTTFFYLSDFAADLPGTWQFLLVLPAAGEVLCVRLETSLCDTRQNNLRAIF